MCQQGIKSFVINRNSITLYSKSIVLYFVSCCKSCPFNYKVGSLCICYNNEICYVFVHLSNSFIKKILMFTVNNIVFSTNNNVIFA